MSLKQLIEGWKNTLAPEEAKKALINYISKSRTAICLKCPYHSKNHKAIRFDAHCTHCGCTLIAKTNCLSCSCPIGKWNAVVDKPKEDKS